MSETTTPVAIGFGQRLRRERRRIVKQTGKKLIRSLANFLGRQSLVGDTPVVDSKHFPFLKPFTDNWRRIESEVAEILKYRDAIPVFQDVSPDQMRIATGKNWRTFILYGFGTRLEKNCKQAPFTTELLSNVPNLQSAWFSILGPNYHIPPHRGVTKGILRVHLGIKIPKNRDHCYLNLADKKISWKQGELFVFDDTYVHEVYNNTDEERVILLFDFDRPMAWPGRLANATFLALMKLTAYYQEPKKNMATFEDRFEAATRRNSDNFEKLSDDA
jgi:ornithine lipid ester-linked acyl 2-hydroxylase